MLQCTSSVSLFMQTRAPLEYYASIERAKMSRRHARQEHKSAKQMLKAALLADYAHYLADKTGDLQPTTYPVVLRHDSLPYLVQKIVYLLLSDIRK